MRANFTTSFSHVSTRIAAPPPTPRRWAFSWAAYLIAVLALTCVGSRSIRLDAAQFYPLGPTGDLSLSGDGHTVVGWAIAGEGGFGFRWTAAEGQVPIPIGATGVDFDGTVIVGSCPGIGPCRWTADGTILPLLQIIAPGSSVEAVSGDGNTAVGEVSDTGDNDAAIWRITGETVSLTVLGPPNGTTAYAVSGDGGVVVGGGGQGGVHFDGLKSMACNR